MKHKLPILFLLLGTLFIFLGLSINRLSETQITNKRVSSAVTSWIKPTLTLGLTEESILPKEDTFITYVFDGDTIETTSHERVRYIGINAPEEGQPFFSESLEKNKSLVLNKKVRLEFDVQAKDRYNRTLAYVFVGATFINLEMVRQRLAVSETIQPNVKYQNEFLKAQKQACSSCLGIWKGLCSSSNCIKILSISANAAGNDNLNKNGEWVDIANACSSSVSMNGWLLKDNSASNKYQFHDFSLEAGRNVRLYSGCGKNLPNKLYWQCPELKYAVLNNSGDHAFLYNNRAELVADYEY